MDDGSDDGERSTDRTGGSAMRVGALVPLRVACGIGVADSLVALATAVLARPDAVSIAVGVGWVLAWACALATAPRWIDWIAARGWLLLPLGLLGLVPALFDGGYPGNLATQPVWIVLVAAALAGWRVTLAIGAALCLGKLGVFLATGTPAAVLAPWSSTPSEATTATLAPLGIAVLGLVLVAGLRRVLDAFAEPEAAAISVGSGAAVATAAADGPAPPRLSPAEQAVVALLADGLTPKQIAHSRGTSLETVRTQIKRAKRATQARTLDELVASGWRPR